MDKVDTYDVWGFYRTKELLYSSHGRSQKNVTRSNQRC